MFAVRRRFMVCLLILVPCAGFADEDRFLVTPLAPDLLLLSTDQGSYSNNSLVFTGPDGVLLVDTHHAVDAAAFKDFIDGLGFGAPRYIISTHRHVEHIGGNALWGADPVIVAHERFPDKLRSGTFLFAEYPSDAFPDITFADSLEIAFNGEIIRLVTIGGSHDDNEILVHFTRHGIAHTSSVVNGFNFPSVDGDGDVMRFESLARRLMTLLPRDTRIVSGHNGRATGFDFVGAWDQLPAYADMMKDTIALVRRELADGRTEAEMQAAGILDAYDRYAGSYVDAAGWITCVVDALTVPRETRADICRPVYAVWKADGAEAAVKHYRHLLATREPDFDFNEYVLLSIGSKLYTGKHYEDAVVFLEGSTQVYPDSESTYYTRYLLAKVLQKLDRIEDAAAQCRLSVQLNGGFENASNLLAELTGASDGG